MASESVKVIIRCRPLNEREYGLKCKKVVDIEGSRGQCLIINPNDRSANPKAFFFDGTYDENSTTEQLYSDIVYPLVENVTEGYNGTVFAYGQTGCGKSFTMQGITNPETQRGVIPRAFDHVFETISVTEKTKYLVHASYLEIYNEDIRDLLAKDTKAKLDLKEHPEKGIYVAGLSMHKVSCVKECQTVMEKGWKNRSTGATLMNVDSSRSHSIFTIYLEMIDTDTNGSKNKENRIRAGKLNLVDLAGSERQSKTGSVGDRLKEATKINLSLSALGNVISALVDGKSKHVPYRDSKLTRILQDSLGGNTKTLMIACLSPADNNYDETLSTLRYANRAKNIQNKPKINEDPKDALLRQYQEEINKLKQMLAGQPGLGQQVITNAQNGAAVFSEAEKQKLIEEEREKIRAEYEMKLSEKEQQYSVEAADKENLRQEMEKLKRYYMKKMEKLDESQPHDIDDKVSEENDQKISIGPTNVQDYERMLSKPSYPPPIADEEDVVIVNPEGDQILKQQRAMSARYMQRNEQPLHTAKNDLLAKLSNLESGIIGGEQAANKLVKERRNKKKKFAEEKRQKLIELNEKMEDDGIMLNVYENIQDDLKSKSKLIQKMKDKISNLQQEILDLQEEFQREKSDYLDMCRKLERDNQLLQMILNQVQPLIKRNCNYSNFDKIKEQAKFIEEEDKWILPKVKIEKTMLPDADGNFTTVRDEEDERMLKKLNQKTEEYSANDYFSNRRLGSSTRMNQNRQNSPLQNYHSSKDFRAAEVHGQLQYQIDNPNNANWRSGHRLETISVNKRSGKKKRDKYSNENSLFDF